MRINEPLWSVDDVATYLAVSTRTLYDWRARGYGPRALKTGRYLRYDPAEVRRWLDSLAEAA